MYGKIEYEYCYIRFFSCIKYARASVSISKIKNIKTNPKMSKYCSYCREGSLLYFLNLTTILLYSKTPMKCIEINS